MRAKVEKPLPGEKQKRKVEKPLPGEKQKRKAGASKSGMENGRVSEGLVKV